MTRRFEPRSHSPVRSTRGGPIVGAWYLALDTVPFGLPPGFPLHGLAIFNADGTYQFLDGGDFGQATFLNTQHTQQFGAWRIGRGGNVVGTALYLESDLPTGEVLRWTKVQIDLRTDHAGVMTGHATVSNLDCDFLLPIPTALTCPDPIEFADQFVVVPPTEIPVELKRLEPGE